MSTGYGRAWHGYRKARHRLWAAVAGLLVCVAAMAALAPVLVGTRADLFLVLTPVFFWLLGFVSAMQVIFFHCPKCDEYFSMNGLAFRPFAAKCVRCGLKKWAMADGAVVLKSSED